MLKARISVQRNRGHFSFYKRPRALPCGPMKAICISVSFIGAIELAWKWGMLHFWDPQRKNQLARLVAAGLMLMAIVGIALFLGAAQLHQIQVFADTPSAPKAQHTSGFCCCCAVVLPNDERTPHVLPILSIPSAIEWSDPSYLVRLMAIAFGVPVVLLICAILLLVRNRFCTIYLIVLRPHQPFPEIESSFIRHSRNYIFAIRTLGEDVREKFFQMHNKESDDLPWRWFLQQPGLRKLFQARGNRGGESPWRWFLRQLGLRTTTFQLTHDHYAAINKWSRHIDVQSYWILIRFAVGMMLAQRSGSKLRAAYFTYKEHETLIINYLLLVALAVILPAIGWVSKAEDSQFPLIMTGMGVLWASCAFISHRRKAAHLAEWERRTLAMPFRECSLFFYSDHGNVEEHRPWMQLDEDDFRYAIRTFGLEYSEVQQIILTVMLVAYFTILQIVK